VKIIVLVKQVPDTWEPRHLDLGSGLLDRGASERIIDETGERALEVALAHKDRNKDTEVVVLSMGPATATEALRKGLSMGADSAIHVLDDALAGADLARTAAAIAAAVRNTGFDLIVAGNESTDGRGGVLPAMVAEHLGLPHLTSLDSAVVSADAVAGERSTDDGTMAVHASLPAVVSVTERSPEPRFPNFKGIMTAKKKPLAVVSLADLGVDVSSGARSVVVSTAERPARSAGRKVIDEGNAGVELAEFLVAEHLV
jgi:electron transfer flavoprotein beta subunit